ncbi:phage tail protein [Nostoc cycadae]|nr:phage tail protein [Nostoc cycadae]
MTNQILHLQLTSMQLPDGVQSLAVSTSAADFSHSALNTQHSALSTQHSIRAGCDLVVHPPEPSEIVLQLENLGSRILRLNVRLEGNFPAEWCRIGMEGYELAPRSRMDVVLYFQLPADFFENPALATGQSLVLDYHSRIHVNYTEEGTGRQLVETAGLNLYVRPRSLYQKFVPALYREVDFIGRFLKIFEQAFEPAVQTLDVLWAYLDPMTAPQTLLPFLAHWVAWPIDRRWTIERQRYLIRSAVELYRWRGTRRGLRLYIHLYTDLPLDEHITREVDKHICIEEIRGEGFVLGNTRLGEDAMIGGGRPYHFIVRLRPQRPNQVDEQLVRHIIEQEKPAFCTYELYVDESLVNGH